MRNKGGSERFTVNTVNNFTLLHITNLAQILTCIMMSKFAPDCLLGGLLYTDFFGMKDVKLKLAKLELSEIFSLNHLVEMEKKVTLHMYNDNNQKNSEF